MINKNQLKEDFLNKYFHLSLFYLSIYQQSFEWNLTKLERKNDCKNNVGIFRL